MKMGKRQVQRKGVVNYVDNDAFYKRLIEWKSGDTTKIPEDIAVTIMKICENLGKSGRFVGYTWIQEMIEDAIMSCIRFCRNFDPERSNNPFAYFTQIAWNAFIKRITMEKERLHMLYEYRDHVVSLYDLPEGEESDDNSTSKYGAIDNTAKSINRTYIKEKKVKEKTPKQKKNDIERFF